MKKIYSKPEFVLVHMKVQDVITSSPVTGYDPNSTIGDEANIGAPGRRMFDSWYEGF